uniref:Methyltransferase domain-containing protein n=2 Tax=Chaetoceros debilis TaxID=122233 RepID=A0A7S3PZ44_9STRA|mmetsp:Transcript_16033/g.24028  ORF Transcript_16033/g.24028 Transcript_16033/m.24028 type:complete len:344 (+) Transcript_16033:318-1349(+)
MMSNDLWGNYGNVEYWNGRYESDRLPFEWYQEYKGIRNVLHDVLQKTSSSNSKFSNMPDAASKVDGSNFGSIRNATNSCPPKEYCRILIVGCGSSRLGEDMMKDGWGWMVEKPEPYKNGGERSAVVPGITNVDFSEVVITQMEQRANCSFYRTVQAKFNRWTRSKYVPTLSNEMKNNHDIDLKQEIKEDIKQVKKNLSNGTPTSIGCGIKSSNVIPTLCRMSFKCVDVTESLPFPDESFDLIINKGTLDAILCSNGAITRCNKMMAECSRVLKGHGSMVVVSHGTPENRKVCFENSAHWQQQKGGVEYCTVPKPKIGNGEFQNDGPMYHYIYIARKNSNRQCK